MDFLGLQTFASKLLGLAAQHNIPYEVYWYSPETRKLNPQTRIGYYEKNPSSSVTFDSGCKCIITFPRLAFHTLSAEINRHLSNNIQIAYRDDFKSEEDIGFDVYQRVEELKLFIEQDSMESKKYTLGSMLKRDNLWYEAQLKAFENELPSLTPQQISHKMGEVTVHFKDLISYLEKQNNPKAAVQVRRNSGFRHRMIRVHPSDQTKRVGFGSLALVFSHDKNLPKVALPEPPKAGRKKRSGSIVEQYKADPSSFKYYDKFGIFEVYDR